MAVRDVTGEEAKLNLTPMIDMTFLLVVFFMLTIDLTQKEFANLDLPYARTGEEDKENPTGPPRFVVNLLPNGDIQFKKNVWKLASGTAEEQENALIQLRNELASLVKDQENRKWIDPDNTTQIPIMIHGDRNARWQYVQWIMMVCADPKIAIYKIQFAVKKPLGEEEASAQ